MIKIKGGLTMVVEESSPHAIALLVEDRRTLEQLSSTVLLAVGPLNEASCLRIAVSDWSNRIMTDIGM